MPASQSSFLVHHSGERPDLMQSFFDGMAANAAGIRIGANAWLPRNLPAYTTERLAEWSSAASYAFADPEMHKMELPFAKRGRGRTSFDYLQDPNPASNRPQFVDYCLSAQDSVGSEILVSPYLLHGQSGTPHELLVTLDFAMMAINHPLAQQATLLLGFEATEGVFANAGARHNMLNQLVEMPPSSIYLRMRVGPPQGRSQYREEEPLRGLRFVIERLVDNGWRVVLPRSGLMGWLMMGFGATTFGSGNSATMQRNVTPGLGGGGGFQPLHWYFLPQLLGFVLAEELPQLSQVPGFVPCGCPFCADSPPAAGAGFDREAAGHHYLYWCAYLASEVAQAPNALSSVQQRLASATAFWIQTQAAAVPLDARSIPHHLEVWTAVAT